MLDWMKWQLAPRVFSAAGEGGGGGGEDTQAGGGTDTVPGGGGTDTVEGGGDPPAAKWWEGLSETHKGYLTPKGLTVDDPVAAATKLIDIAANAEKRIGKGLDSIMDRPAKGQDYGEWARANAEALGLPKEAGGYEVKPPADWPKDLEWDGANEAKARDIAFKFGVPPAAHQAYIALQTQIVRDLDRAAADGLAQARQAMDAELQKDWGDQLEARKARAGQTMRILAEKAGVTTDGIQALSQTLSGASSDATVLRIIDVVAEMMGDDTGIAMGRGPGQFGMTPAEARAELKRFEGPEGEYGKAFAAGDRVKLAELRARREQLSKLAAG